MRIERYFTKANESVYDQIHFRHTDVVMKNPDGSVAFECEGVEVPEAWSEVATDVLAQQYFRKAGVPKATKTVEEDSVPEWLWSSVPDGEAMDGTPDEDRYSMETSAKQVFDRLAGAWTYWGWKGGYFDTEEDASAFFDELRYMLACHRLLWRNFQRHLKISFVRWKS